jgi:hypothetical protein
MDIVADETRRDKQPDPDAANVAEFDRWADEQKIPRQTGNGKPRVRPRITISGNLRDDAYAGWKLDSNATAARIVAAVTPLTALSPQAES